MQHSSYALYIYIYSLLNRSVRDLHARIWKSEEICMDFYDRIRKHCHLLFVARCTIVWLSSRINWMCCWQFNATHFHPSWNNELVAVGFCLFCYSVYNALLMCMSVCVNLATVGCVCVCASAYIYRQLSENRNGNGQQCCGIAMVIWETRGAWYHGIWFDLSKLAEIIMVCLSIDIVNNEFHTNFYYILFFINAQTDLTRLWNKTRLFLGWFQVKIYILLLWPVYVHNFVPFKFYSELKHWLWMQVIRR